MSNVTMDLRHTWRLLALALTLGYAAAFALPARAQPVDVNVTRDGERIVVDVTLRIAVAPTVAWDVLTDYDHMSSYVSALQSSRVVKREGNVLHVAQSGSAQRAFLHFSFSTLRAVHLTPTEELRSHLISGDSFKSYDFVTRITANDDHTSTVRHHGEYVPTAWVPPMIGPQLIADETRKQYTELGAEMLRRHAATPKTP